MPELTILFEGLYEHSSRRRFYLCRLRPGLLSKGRLSRLRQVKANIKPKGPANTDPWYFTAIDFHTGETVYSKLIGTRMYYSPHYAVTYLGKGKTAYGGVIEGKVTIQDGK